ncbi:hypothetical protein GCM10023172_15010 [Hymenobacter ginsengisoli]|uniref:Tetratricopeptide repeat protein n=1 Tax=Hymenobacter ginsengisoli TaxID=1051626 RepID=A0ABP8Q6M1_9BACT|nr:MULTISPECIES: hypothetical protein [unclassified Hymenobacter]MBO2030949.1 hypothetical protein [Hymenobacter sp. BT559]
MTRATLLQLLAHPTALTGADVHALEQLAEAFPYCQTAHLLLAKAAHDQSSMLAGQRLRRAATYAADRTLLRQLIEQRTPAELAVVAAGPPAAALPITLPPESTSSAEPAFLPEQQAAEPAAVLILEDKPDQLIGLAVPDKLGVEAELLETPVAEAEDELPAQAPPIYPPAQAAAAHAEFGLALEEPAELIAYQLPGLEVLAVPPIEALPATPLLPTFNGLAGVSYAPSEGSRLGFGLVSAAAAEVLPGTNLPPAGEFFAPDALLLDHLVAHQAPTLPRSSSLDLINSFLQRSPAPVRRRVAPLPNAPEPDEQADLSVRSTRAEPDLASESLAKILARQGKTDRAIAVYERLMVKHPEKMAYFAAQIKNLSSGQSSI